MSNTKDEGNIPGDSQAYIVRITNREMYDMLVSVRDTARAMEYRLDSILIENVNLNKRIRALELRYYGLLAGMIASISALGIGLGIG